MHGHRKSDSPIVLKKPSNKRCSALHRAEGVEGRGLTKGNLGQQNRNRTQRRIALDNALNRIRQAATDKKLQLTALWHHVYDVERLEDAYYSLKRKSAPGIDGITWQQYGENLRENLEDLSGRLKRGAYKPKPVKRVYIPKPDGRQRPIGITAVEDKIVQHAVTEVLNAVYETTFCGFSYGFRPKRSQHNALDAVSVAINRRRVRWILDADISGFFDTISWEKLVELIGYRIADQRIIRQIKKWLHAGVLEDGEIVEVVEGTPQGGCISPLLANIYLHYVLDLWVSDWRRNKAHGVITIVRYADDFVMGFEYRSDAVKFMKEIRLRMLEFNLKLHPDKTRLIEFGRYAAIDRQRRGDRKPETFAFLGFTHICGETRAGNFQLFRHTIGKRLTKKLCEIREELRKRLHDPIPKTGAWLGAVLEGHYQYFGVPNNWYALSYFFHQVICLWKRSLTRRSQRHKIDWDRMKRLVKTWLPKPRIVHAYPETRLCVRP